MTKPETPKENDSLLPVSQDEESRIRRRPERVSTVATKPDLGPSMARPQRLARALRFAELLVETLPASDSSRALLELAIKRRDEALLEGVLKDLHRKQREIAERSLGKP